MGGKEVAVYRKPILNSNEEVCMLFCCFCGEIMIWPMDADYFPAFCKSRCAYEFEVNDKNENEDRID